MQWYLVLDDACCVLKKRIVFVSLLVGHSHVRAPISLRAASTRDKWMPGVLPCSRCSLISFEWTMPGRTSAGVGTKAQNPGGSAWMPKNMHIHRQQLLKPTDRIFVSFLFGFIFRMVRASPSLQVSRGSRCNLEQGKLVRPCCSPPRQSTFRHQSVALLAAIQQR